MPTRGRARAPRAIRGTRGALRAAAFRRSPRGMPASRASGILRDRGKHAAGGFDGRRDFRLAVRSRYETRLERRGCEIDSRLQHAVEVTPETARVARHHLAIIGYRSLGCKEEAEHSTD